MCGLFGYKALKKDLPCTLKKLIEKLGENSFSRGPHATGISYIRKDKLQVDKAAVSAYKFKYYQGKSPDTVLGHVRFTTQGSEHKNYNNHPFYGTAGKMPFTLAHNGVLHGEDIVRAQEGLSQTKIETDSYLAVQLLEKAGDLSMDSLKYMAEKVHGYFTFSLLDRDSNMYFVKGESPLIILHFKKLGLFMYASERSILINTLEDVDMGDLLIEAIALGDKSIEVIEPKNGDILKINKEGKLEYGKFKSHGYSWAGYSTKRNYLTTWDTEDDFYSTKLTKSTKITESNKGAIIPLTSNTKNPPCSKSAAEDAETYSKLLRVFAQQQGYTEADITTLLKWGYKEVDIEDALYNYYLDDLLSEVKALYEEETIK